MGWTGSLYMWRTGYFMRDRVHAGRKVAGDGAVRVVALWAVLISPNNRRGMTVAPLLFLEER